MNRVAMLLALMILMGLTLTAQAAPADQNCEQCLGGWADAPIRIEVFSDFQCPACRALFLDTMKYVLRDYASVDKVCVIYHEFPLAAHPYSREAARYSVAAQKLGRQQWVAVVESLYKDQDEWSKTGQVQMAVAKALSLPDFERVLKLKQDPSINEVIERDIALGQKREVLSTPTFFVTALNREQKVVGGLPYLTLKQFFDQIVK
jgi:protein-disulfide isomerase